MQPSSRADSTYHRLCSLEEAWAGEMAEFDVHGTKILLIHTYEGHLTAIQAMCPHQRVPLVEGELLGSVLSCRAHGWQMDVRSGRGLNPHHAHVAVYPLRVEDGQIFVSIEGVKPQFSRP